jgi:hypothetical protein
VIHDEPWCVLGAHRHVTHALGERGQRVAHPGRGHDPVDHFHHLHQRDRVEEMEPGHPLRTLARRGDGGHLQRGGVGREDALGRHDALEVREELAFRGELLHDRLDHHLARIDVREDVRDLDPLGRRLGRVGRQTALLGKLRQHLPNVVARGGGGLRSGVVEHHPDAGLGRDLGDAASHDPGPDDRELEIGAVGIQRHGRTPWSSGEAEIVLRSRRGPDRQAGAMFWHNLSA